MTLGLPKPTDNRNRYYRLDDQCREGSCFPAFKIECIEIQRLCWVSSSLTSKASHVSCVRAPPAFRAPSCATNHGPFISHYYPSVSTQLPPDYPCTLIAPRSSIASGGRGGQRNCCIDNRYIGVAYSFWLSKIYSRQR
eukprot:763597-Hanusia_phi.AAC.3